MKKIVCLTAVVLMVVSVAVAAEIKMKKITAKDLPGLKGTWVGSLQFGGITENLGNSYCTMEILNDTVPVKGKLTLSSVPDAVAAYFGLMAGKNEFDLEEGKLTTQGTILWISPEKNMFEVSMGREKYLDAAYWFRELKGIALLKKK